MNPGWASALTAMLIMIFTGTGMIWRAGRHDGKVDAALEKLTEITIDHEKRLRAQEERRRR